MARPQKHDEAKRTILIRVRVTPQEKQRLTDAADQRGMTLSDHVRTKAIGSDPLIRKAAPQRAAFIRALAELGKQGSNINQIARSLNRQQMGGRVVDVPAELIRRALANIIELTDKLLALLEYGHSRTNEG